MDSTGAKASNPRCPLVAEVLGAVLYLVVSTWSLSFSKGRFENLSELKLLTLALLVTRVGLADHHDIAVATDDAAVVTDGLDAGVYLHDGSLYSLSSYPQSAAGRYFPAEWLLVAVSDAATGQVVGAQLHNHPVLREDSDVVLSHFA